ncbi:MULTISPECIES: BREX-1 system phosphatase PglZ type A [unclassified Actinobaculum]|uniref:BREX-1 system phosphatase PglZ type A n=1 Tax=unclassified Actinobaculum TaxID=2609299 RepID=UPI000D527A50|nr:MULTISPECIES: BREX-1 system phosphatase PglZ type A [unclassified Actinobaculum]AWE42793.1 BREX-1 system phosphatase PglZ type A [Actinobaculum sp. 313]RTE49602.1 BREX-1 system phosphatase PglZ type A [Actinobaculum sp. 352]
MSFATAVLPHLERQFTRQRLVFWHDPDGEYADEVDKLNIPGVTTVEVLGDEFALKYRMLKEEPKGKFLVYRQGIIPDGIGNWLLDLELAYGVFSADRAALLRQDLGLTSDDVVPILDAHKTFFRSVKRTEALRALRDASDNADLLRAKMCAVLFGQREHSLLELTRTLLIENAQGLSEKCQLLGDYGLLDFHWAGVARIYRYQADQPTVDDFILWMFRQAINGFRSDEPGMLRNIQLDFSSLRNDRRSADALAILAKRAAKDLDYARQIEDADLSEFRGNDLFEEVEQKIVSGLATQVADRRITVREVDAIVRSRQSSIWVDEYRDQYEAIRAASELLTMLATNTFEVPSFDEGLQRYQEEWYRVDQLYRQFQRATRDAQFGETVQKTVEKLWTEVENHYGSRFLGPLGAAWQHELDTVSAWRSRVLRPQRAFYRDYVAPLVSKRNNKAAVIISDALRYEIAAELGALIRQEDRFDARIDATLGTVPSYTQLGMAALLPHNTLAHSDKGDPILVDGQPSDGTTNRTKILSAVDGYAIQAEDVLAMGNKELKQLYTEHRVFYIYHDRIDATGDKLRTERRVFEAVEEALKELVRLVKKLASANANNIFITADHGFLYQDSELPEAGYLSEEPQGDKIVVRKSRYVLGRGLKENSAFKKFTSEQLGLASDLEVQIPKSIHRLKLSGAGARYVHGGATLQEIVVPVLAVNKKRKSDTRAVNVQILPETDKITTGQLVVKLFQSEAVTDKIQARTLRAGLYAGEQLISNQVELLFDQPSGDARDRYQSVQLLLSEDADPFNNRRVQFRLEELIPNTSQWRTCDSVEYTLRRSFTTDFEL